MIDLGILEMNPDSDNRSEDAGFAICRATLDYGSKLVEFSFMNVSAVFDGTRRLAGVKSPQEFYQLWVDLTREHFERISEQAEELAMFTQAKNEKDGNDARTVFWE